MVGGPGGEESGHRLAASLGEYLFKEEEPPDAPNASNGDGAETSRTTCEDDRMGDVQTPWSGGGQRTRGKREDGWRQMRQYGSWRHREPSKRRRCTSQLSNRPRLPDGEKKIGEEKERNQARSYLADLGSGPLIRRVWSADLRYGTSLS